MCRYEFSFALVPGFEDGLRGCAAEDARVNKAGKADTGNMPRGAEDAFEVPDCFGTEMVDTSAFLSHRLVEEHDTHGLG